MPLENRARPRADPRSRLQICFQRLRPVWPYVMVAAALLGASEVLWLWHSWPVRQVLEGEQVTAGASI